jgi:4'-phosphopantetheinyl transferase
MDPRTALEPCPAVEVVASRLDLDPGAVDALAGWLHDDECRRAGRFRLARDRRRYVVARGLLRTLLAARLGTHPRSVELCCGAHGKPRLAPGSAAGDLRFNVSHTGDFALFAFSRGREVGVDVEAVLPMRDADAVARHFFSRSELRAYRALEPGARQAGFFTCWTRKEAYLKALGGGLPSPLSEFDAPPGWSLSSFSPAPGHAAALAVEPRRNA